MIELMNVTKQYSNAPVLKNVTLKIDEPGIYCFIIEEIAKTIQKLIIIDKGCIRFFDTLQAVETKAFSVSGLKKDVDAATANHNVIRQDTVGGLVTSYLFDNPPVQTASLEIHPLSL